MVDSLVIDEERKKVLTKYKKNGVKLGLKKFKEITSKNYFLSEIFNNEDKNNEVKTKQFLKKLGFYLSQSFKKVRIGNTKKNSDFEDLLNKRIVLKIKKNDFSAEKLKDVDKKLSDMCAEDNLRKIRNM